MLIETLKEMGIVCQNKNIGEKLKQFHYERFKYLSLYNGEQAKEHLKQFLFWGEKVGNMNKHLQQLHKRIKKETTEEVNV